MKVPNNQMINLLENFAYFKCLDVSIQQAASYRAFLGSIIERGGLSHLRQVRLAIPHIIKQRKSVLQFRKSLYALNPGLELLEFHSFHLDPEFLAAWIP
jgi:hypothetical protein